MACNSLHIARRHMRVSLPTQFGLDALCCDLLVNSPSGRSLRILFINVHLNSLPIRPSWRPQHPAVAASYLSAAGRGLVAGDFNPLFAEDDIICSNGLVNT
ncbi:hypothetical protein BU26DRAFT_524118 [Trematosphaeria pertusa]|uniref:Endonuclease/exonuclease/phosphatase domain-containing protein n=1 Tax=Trematosphaeria pertusa TaxID=390896 RepID=A0A6A6HYQ4_9PLEO|nr:uncharacterized protein BU26DRAFT_524118 [Trematosphaeria pertusa]KAF2242490.1 hypothetical protein BU26DRAFT_524118 [Trematosphaeria pertusa]